MWVIRQWPVAITSIPKTVFSSIAITLGHFSGKWLYVCVISVFKFSFVQKGLSNGAELLSTYDYKMAYEQDYLSR